MGEGEHKSLFLAQICPKFHFPVRALNLNNLYSNSFGEQFKGISNVLFSVGVTSLLVDISLISTTTVQLVSVAAMLALSLD